MKDQEQLQIIPAANIHKLASRGVMALRHKQVAMRSMAQAVYSLASGEHGELSSAQLQEIVELADSIRQMADEAAAGMNQLCEQINVSRMG